eukprot:4768174-Pyramimonas_sp.AAC.1
MPLNPDSLRYAGASPLATTKVAVNVRPPLVDATASLDPVLIIRDGGPNSWAPGLTVLAILSKAPLNASSRANFASDFL